MKWALPEHRVGLLERSPEGTSGDTDDGVCPAFRRVIDGCAALIALDLLTPTEANMLLADLAAVARRHAEERRNRRG